MPKLPIKTALLRAALLAGTAGALAGCALPGRFAGVSESPVDPNSPVAKDVVYASRHPGPFPRFSEIPSIPGDLRPLSDWKIAIAEVRRSQARLNAQVEALPPPPADTEAFSAEARSRLGPPPAPPAPETAPQETEDYARALRERATPPPSPR